MDLKKFWTRLLGAAIILTLSQPARAGKLDVDFIQTSPAKAMVYSIAFPGGGHYFLSKTDPKYKKKFYLYLAAGIGSGVVLFATMRGKNKPLFLPALLLAGGVKIWEFGSVVDDAEGERLKWLKKNFTPYAAEVAPVNGPVK